MKRYLIILALLIVPAAKGAYFEHYAGSLYSSGQVYAEDNTSIDGPYSDNHENFSDSWVELSAEVTDAYGYANTSIWDINFPENQSLCLRANSFVDVIATDIDCNAFGYGYASTEDQQTYGTYYQIVPGPGEQFGDEVIVSCSTTIKIVNWGQTYAYIGGTGEMDHMAITKGQLPPVSTQPQSNFEVWTMDNLELTDEGFDGYAGISTFHAEIGDVIGIFAENYSDIGGVGPLDGLIESDLTIVLTVKTILAGDIDEDNDVDLYDFTKLADNWLKGK
jgi:hypothetical protein